jgi:hypothetical protein
MHQSPEQLSFINTLFAPPKPEQTGFCCSWGVCGHHNLWMTPEDLGKLKTKWREKLGHYNYEVITPECTVPHNYMVLETSFYYVVVSKSLYK